MDPCAPDIISQIILSEHINSDYIFKKTAIDHFRGCSFGPSGETGCPGSVTTFRCKMKRIEVAIVYALYNPASTFTTDKTAAADQLSKTISILQVGLVSIIQLALLIIPVS